MLALHVVSRSAAGERPQGRACRQPRVRVATEAAALGAQATLVQKGFGQNVFSATRSEGGEKRSREEKVDSVTANVVFFKRIEMAGWE